MMRKIWKIVLDFCSLITNYLCCCPMQALISRHCQGVLQSKGNSQNGQCKLHDGHGEKNSVGPRQGSCYQSLLDHEEEPGKELN